MPIGGFDGLGWDETVPSDGEAISLGDDRIKSLKTSLRNGLDSEHNWPSAGGNAVGFHKLGSARAFVVAQSAISSSGTDGRVGWASDTSQFFHVGSGGTALIGGTRVLSIGTTAGFGYPQRHQWVEEMGHAVTSSGGSVTITFPNSGFSGIPYTFAQVVATVDQGNVLLSVATVDGASVIVSSILNIGGSFVGSQAFFWRSLGTRAL